MFLETISSIVSRFKKRKPLTMDTSTLPNSINRLPFTPFYPFPPSAVTNPGASPYSAPYSNIAPSNEGFLPGAHDFAIYNPTMISFFDSGKTVLHILTEKRMIGAEVDSSARDPPPKCHPDTRKSLRGRIVHWATSPHRHWRMLWIMGPAGVGKSAVAQAIAEEFKASGHLGAALFFSRLNDRNDPDRVIPTLAYQLAIKHPQYQRIITQRFAEDPRILEKNRRTLFKELIIEPFQILMTQHPTTFQQPLLIVLDGLDECNSKEAQSEFIGLISSHVREVKTFPLLWMICSRPEWHFRYLLSEPDFQVTCQREEMVIDDDEARQDVSRFLHDCFGTIQQKYRDRLEPEWPPKAYLRQISAVASGHFGFVCTIIRFVGNTHTGNPSKQLDICIRFLGGFGFPGAMNPLHALDLLYRQILSNIPADTLPATLRILGMCVLYPRFTLVRPLSAQNLANFLCIDRATFYHSLEGLHSVLNIPPATDAHNSPIRFYHASFGDYLSNPDRSRDFCITKSTMFSDLLIYSLQWLKPAQLRPDIRSPSCPKIEWVRPEDSPGRIIPTLKKFSLDVEWDDCHHISGKDVTRVVAELERFDFNNLDTMPAGFMDFLSWLYKMGDRNKSLIRVDKPGSSITFKESKPLYINCRTPDLTQYVSAYGLPTNRFQVEYTLHLQLGLAGNARDIVMSLRRCRLLYTNSDPLPHHVTCVEYSLESLQTLQRQIRNGLYVAGNMVEDVKRWGE